MNPATYLYGQLKRIIKLFPKIFGLSVVFALVIGICGKLYADNSDYNGETSVYEIGVMCDTEDELVSLGLHLLKTLDDSKYVVNIVEIKSEQEGFDALHKDEISAFIVVPSEFIDALNYLQTPPPVRLYTASQKGLTTSVMGEVASIVSDDIVYSEAGLLTYEELILLSDIDRSEWGPMIDGLFMKYMSNLFHRGELTEIKVLGLSKGLSLLGYFLCGVLLFYTVMLSFCAISFFLGRRTEFHMLSSAAGVGAFMQIMCEFLCFLITNFLCAAFTLLCLFIVLNSGLIEIEEFTRYWPYCYSSFAGSYILVLIALSAFEFMLFEVIGGIINKFLMTFMVLIGTSFLSGYFYPRSFLPKTAAKIGSVLPTGFALDALSNGLTEEKNAVTYVGLVVYTLVFMAVSVYSRKVRIEKGID